MPDLTSLVSILIVCTLVASLFPTQWALAEPSSSDEGVQQSDTTQVDTTAPTSSTTQPVSADEEPLEYGETLNDGTTLVPVADNSSLSSASLMGFDTTRENTVSEECGTDNPVSGWVGVTPLEYGRLTYDDLDSDPSNLKSPLWITDIRKTTAENLDYDSHYRDLFYDFDADGRTIGAVAPADLDHNGLDDLAVLTSDGKVRIYNTSYAESGYFSQYGAGIPPAYLRGNIAVLDPGRAFYPRTEGSESRKQIDFENYNPTMQEPNLYHLKAGDLDGNGYEDIVMFSYNESGEGWIDVWYTFYLTDARIDDSTPLPSGWQASELLGEKPREGNRFLFYHQSIAADNMPLLNANIYSDNMYLPASLEVADLSGDGKAEAIVAFQGGDPLGGSRYCSAIQVVQASAGTDQQFQIKDANGNPKTVTVTQPNFEGTCSRWAPPGGPCTQMTSVSVGDVDADNHPELVVGGYAGSDALQGELYLTYLEWVEPEDGSRSYLDTTNVHGFTWLSDDNGLHKTLGSKLYGHKANEDTSLYYEDADSTFFKSEASNYQLYNLSRYTNTSNWTVPLSCVSLSGYVDNNTYDQVFFGSFFYNYDKASATFTPWRGRIHEDFNEMDNNNILLMLSEPTAAEDMIPNCDSPDAGLATMMDYPGGEILYQMALFDQTKNYGDKVRIDRYTYCDNGSSVAFSCYGDMSDKTEFAWGENSPEIPFLANLDWLDDAKEPQDKDSMFLRLVGHEFVYTEPVVESVLQAPPSFEDVSLATGYDSGSTALTRIEGDTIEYGASASVSFDFNILYGAEAGKNSMKVGKTPGFGVTPSYKGSKTHEEQYSVNISKGQDSVVLTCTPMDLYYYEVLRPGAQKPLDLAVMRAPNAPNVKIVPIETYNEQAINYNKVISAFNERLSDKTPRLALLPEADTLMSHTKGKPETYTRPDGLDTSEFNLTDRPLALDYGNDFGSSSQSLLSTWKNSDGGSCALNLKMGLKFEESSRFNKFTLAFGINLSGNGGKSVYNGKAYKGDVKCLTEEWNDYGMSMTMYAGKKTYTTIEDPMSNNDSVGEYVVVGYDTENVRYGVATPRGLKIADTTAHTVDIVADIPWGADNSDSSYLLERLDSTTGQWQTVHTFKKPNLDGTSPTVFTETFTDQGGPDGNGTDERLASDTSYTYRVTDSQRKHSCTAVAQTEKVDSFTVTFDEFNPWGLMAARSVSAETGWKHALSNGALFTDGSQLDFIALPFNGWQVDSWQVTETRDGIASDITSDPRVKVFDDGKVLVISEAHGDIAVKATSLTPVDPSAPDNPDGPVTPTAIEFSDWGMSLVGSDGTTLASDERISHVAAKETPTSEGAEVSGEDANEVTEDADSRESAENTGATDTKPVDTLLWITDAGAKLNLSALNVKIGSILLASPANNEKTLQMIGAEEGRISETISPLSDGTHKVIALAQSVNDPLFDARTIVFAKDSQVPDMAIWCINGVDENGSSANNGTRTIMVWPTTGPSDVGRVEIARGQNATSGFVDVSNSYKKGITYIAEWADPTLGPDKKPLDDGRLENGWYTLRLTNGAGVVSQKSVELTGVTHPLGKAEAKPEAGPVTPPDGDGGGSGSTSNPPLDGKDPNAGGTKKPAALVETGDTTYKFVIAFALVAAVSAVIAAVIRLARRRA
ncbi:hypothetical protein [Adlercreutzia sp. ZJ138]|uniref:FG-GAP repeat protein n=1 Tax=Adlercreutzia sp. ZJ138 TaxID=2709405 RepID=UPI0013EC5AC3|nr:hypothetical protein [Adlercreutzia sp. ZJ138]